MRGRLVRFLVWFVVGLSLVAAAGAPAADSTMVSQDTATRLDELDRLLDELITLLQGPHPEGVEVTEKFHEVLAAFSRLLESFPPVYGIAFDGIFRSLFSIETHLNEVGQSGEHGLAGTFNDCSNAAEARRLKESLEWAMLGGQLRTQSQCGDGKVLVVAYPGFECYEFRSTIQRLLDAGKCVVITWHEAAGHKAGDPTRPTAARVLDCLRNQFRVGPRLRIEELPSPDESFPEVLTLGDVNAAVHVPQMPTSPHPSYADSMLAMDVVRGAPTEIDPNRPLHTGDVIKPWYAIGNLCNPASFEWRYYDPSGSLVTTQTQKLNPADFGTGCLSNYSSAGWLMLEPDQFATGGTYAAELWIDGTYSALHSFNLAGGAPRPPIVNDDFYATDEDTALRATDHPLTANDIDPDYGTLTTTLSEGPRHGTLDLSTDGTFVYQPDANYYGVDGFTYSATDPSGLSATGQATILVNPVNDPPVAAADAFVVSVSPDETTWSVTSPNLGAPLVGTFGENGNGLSVTIPAPGVLFNDADPDNDPLTARPAGSLPPMVNLMPDGSLTIAVSVPDLPATFSIPYVAWDPSSGLESQGRIDIVVKQEEGGS